MVSPPAACPCELQLGDRGGTWGAGADTRSDQPSMPAPMPAPMPAHSCPTMRKVVAESVRWHGRGTAQIVATSIVQHAPGTSLFPTQASPSIPSGFLGKGALLESSDDEGPDAISPEYGPYDDDCSPGGQENVGQAQSMRSLEKQYQFNANLVKQYEELSTIFKAWRPVRGDGNCYYRAVIFSWLERSLALGKLDSLVSFCSALKSWKAFPTLVSHVKTCRSLLRLWIRKRMQCRCDATVGELLVEVHEQFRRNTCDRAFIKCLRQLVAQYLQEHALDNVDDKGGDNLTYASWIMAISGAAGIEAYCSEFVLRDNEDAADVVQWICPIVLNTFVRICIVDRDTAKCHYVDYSAGMGIPASGEKVRNLKSAREMVATSNLGGQEPEIYLLLKPGHYDILVNNDDPVARFVGPRPTSFPGSNGADAVDTGTVRKQVDMQWRSVLKTIHRLRSAIMPVLGCLDEKLAEELQAKKRRGGSLDETLFLGQVASVMEPLRDALQQLSDLPDDTLFGEEPASKSDVPSVWSVLPNLGKFFNQPVSPAHSPQRVKQPAPSPKPVLISSEPPGPPKIGKPVVVSVDVSNKLRASPAMQVPTPDDPLPPPPSAVHVRQVDAQADLRAPDQASPGAAAEPPPPAAEAGAAAGNRECNFCMQRGATLRASQCGCFYHAQCLKEYVEMEVMPHDKIMCHIHDQAIGADVISQALSFATPGQRAPAPAPAPAPSVRAPPTLVQPLQPAQAQPLPRPGASGGAYPEKQPQQPQQAQQPQQPPPSHRPQVKQPPSPSALDQAQPIGLATQRQLDSMGAGDPLPSRNGVPHIPGSYLSAKAQRGAEPIIVESQPPGFGPSKAFVPSGAQKVPMSNCQGLMATGHVLPGSCAIPPSTRRLLQTGNLGCALGIPCVICFGEEGKLKTLHCGYKAHVECLKTHWREQVCTLCRLSDIRCPAEVAGCDAVLTDVDLRGVVSAEDLQAAERNIKDMDEKNRTLVDELKRQMEEYRPMFQCAICLMEHEIEGCCTLPCGHRFCFESLQHHFDIIVRERRLSKLSCPAEGCGHNLRDEAAIHIFQHCLSEETYNKLLEFLTRDDPHIYDCKHLGCEERVWCDDEGDIGDLQCTRGHSFCGRCENGPHPGISCEQRQEELARQKKEAADIKDGEDAWASALKMGWKPCPRRCKHGGGFKADEECDHVTCECGFEFCWDCGVDRRVLIAHDNRWHKPRCRYHTRPEEVAEPPRRQRGCPECEKCAPGAPCQLPPDDGYPESYLKRRFIAAAR